VRPLDFLRSIKAKLGVVIVAAVVATTAILAFGDELGLAPWLRVLLAVAVGLALVQGLARGMTSPLREMAAAASEMARGAYERRVTATSRDEVGELARAFNAMAADLGDVERMRRDLVANVSHELRTPIGALQAVLENLADGVEDPHAIDVALAQTQRLGRLVEQLLDLSRLESGTLPIAAERFRVGELLDRAARELVLGERDVRLRIEVDPIGLEATGDPERLQQVLANLLDNAVRHSPPEGRVWLVGYNGGRTTTIAVCDEGPGIPPEEAQRVFERFYRSDAARSTRDGGTGLGLAIARWIVDAHGGSIRAEQRDPHGCRMVLELPAGTTAPPPLKAGPLRAG
jgi:signal transduction histidine kinase